MLKLAVNETVAEEEGGHSREMEDHSLSFQRKTPGKRLCFAMRERQGEREELKLTRALPQEGPKEIAMIET